MHRADSEQYESFTSQPGDIFVSGGDAADLDELQCLSRAAGCRAVEIAVYGLPARFLSDNALSSAASRAAVVSHSNQNSTAWVSSAFTQRPKHPSPSALLYAMLWETGEEVNS
jgi:hypothetical protein